ncbi:hypothetical protein [Mycobacteroides franklinii]|nr:hypothetical protein [Mycobacteroides franklinii]TDZ61592.1 hypothetical protein CCUG63695_04545 [Mycobacteroides franklinii]
MGEKFSVNVEELAGFGAGVEDLAAYLGKVRALVDSEGEWLISKRIDRI